MPIEALLFKLWRSRPSLVSGFLTIELERLVRPPREWCMDSWLVKLLYWIESFIYFSFISLNRSLFKIVFSFGFSSALKGDGEGFEADGDGLRADWFGYDCDG